MRDFYKKMLVDAALEGREFTLRLYCEQDPEGDTVWNHVGISAGEPAVPSALKHTYIICRWPIADDTDLDALPLYAHLDFQEAIRWIEEKFHGYELHEKH